MLRQTGVNPEMPRARAATCDTSSILQLINGPRSVIRTTAERALLIIDVDQRPEWQYPMRGGKIVRNGIFSARRFFAYR